VRKQKIQKSNLRIYLVTLTFIVTVMSATLLNFALKNNRKKLYVSSNDPKIAVMIVEGNKLSGDLWLTNPDGTKKVQVTKTGNIYRVFGWSLDNKYVSVALLEKDTDVLYTQTNFGLIEVANGKITHTKEGIGNNPNLSPDGQWIAIERSAPDVESPVISTRNIKDNKTYIIVPKDKTAIWWQAAWQRNKLLYLTQRVTNNSETVEIWESDPDGTKKIKLLERILNQEDEDVVSMNDYNPRNFVLLDFVSHDKEKNSKLMKYTNNTGELKEIDLSEIARQSGSMNNYYHGASIGNISVSPDENLITFRVSSEIAPFVYTVVLQTNQIFKVCGGSCYDPVWSN